MLIYIYIDVYINIDIYIHTYIYIYIISTCMLVLSLNWAFEELLPSWYTSQLFNLGPRVNPLLSALYALLYYHL